MVDVTGFMSICSLPFHFYYSVCNIGLCCDFYFPPMLKCFLPQFPHQHSHSMIFLSFYFSEPIKPKSNNSVTLLFRQSFTQFSFSSFPLYPSSPYLGAMAENHFLSLPSPLLKSRRACSYLLPALGLHSPNNVTFVEV